MSLGKNIHDLRIQNGMTQKQLGEKMFVTAQAVSRWENDEVEPGITALQSLAEIFGTDIGSLINGTGCALDEALSVPPKPAIGACHDCGKTLHEGDRVFERKITHTSHYGKQPHKETEVVRVCEACNDKANAAEAAEEAKREKRNRELIRSERRKYYGWSIFAGIVAVIAAIIAFNAIEGAPTPPLSILYTALIGYAVFAFIFCTTMGTYIEDIYLSMVDFGFVTFPGIIFDFSLDGCLFFLGLKLVFWLIGIALGVLGFLLSLAICLPLSMITFPFVAGKDPQ